MMKAVRELEALARDYPICAMKLELFYHWAGPLHVDEVALDFPDLSIVCGHVGTPWAEEMIHVAWKYESVFIDTSAWLPKHFEPGFVTFLSGYGQDRCIYASDWPLLDMERPLGQVD